MRKIIKPEITSIRILGYDCNNKEYDLSDCISDDTDASLSNDIEDWRHD